MNGCRMVTTLRFNRHLRSANTLPQAMTDALDLAISSDETDDFREVVESRRKGTVGSHQIRRGRLRLDSMANNLWRRRLTDIAESHPETVMSVHMFSDSSPVTGGELQGMLMEIVLITRVVWKLVMPGVHLSYGQYGVASILHAFVWSFLFAHGPDVDDSRVVDVEDFLCYH